MSHKILVSNGEILDKLTILHIKEQHCSNSEQLHNILTEISVLQPLVNIICNNPQLVDLYDELYSINNKLWMIEDNIRQKEKLQLFDSGFIDLARQVYKTNDMRAKIKKQINQLSASQLIEEKIYEQYN